MTEQAFKPEIDVVNSIDEIDREAWNSLLNEDDSPFVEWDWLHALEKSGSAARATGWAPHHLVVRAGPRKTIVAACPLYLKSHSMGEFVFDHGWADAAERAGIRYYPKLVAGVPFTPHSGRRLLTAPDLPREGLMRLLGNALASLCVDNELSSVHVNFCAPDEAEALAGAGFFERLGYQYHWQNAGFNTFEDYLGRLKSKRRYAVRHERNALAEQGITIKVDVGDEISAAMFKRIFQIYRSTIDKLYWGRQYLTAGFFDLLRQSNFKRYVCFVGAYRGRELLAGTFNLQKAQVLYGRYWGCFEEHKYLHFNVCYYAGIEHCIAQGIERFEPGAGGEYKWLRGFDPALTRSAHFIAHPGLRKAVARFVASERRQVEQWISVGHERSQLKPPPPSDEELE